MGDYVLKNAVEYVVIRDKFLTFKGSRTRIQTFMLPPGIRTDKQPILSFLLNGTRNARFTIKLNGVIVHAHLYADGSERGVVDVIDPVVRSGNNWISFSLEGDRIEFGDVVLWYRRDAIVTPPSGWPTAPANWVRSPRVGPISRRLNSIFARRQR